MSGPGSKRALLLSRWCDRLLTGNGYILRTRVAVNDTCTSARRSAGLRGG